MNKPFFMWLLVALAIPLSGVGALYPSNSVLQLGPMIPLLLAAPFIQKRWPLSNSALACITAFLLLHCVGARWSYSFVPYDDWSIAISGSSLSDIFGWSRNHFDRLVHFLYGALLFQPVKEIAQRYFKLSGRTAIYVALEFLIATSALYEIFEWSLAIGLSPESAEAYNGQQGDIFDAQKDMALAVLGAFLAAILTLLRSRK